MSAQCVDVIPAADAAPVEAILFDLDETLIHEEEVVRDAFAAVGRYAAQQADVDAERFAAVSRRLARKLWRELPIYSFCRELGISSEEGLWASFERESRLLDFPSYCDVYRQSTWSASLDLFGIGDTALSRNLGEYFIEVRRKSCAKLYPDVKATLERLTCDYKLGIVTNGPACLQHEKLERSGIKELLSCIVVSAELGMGKPEPGIFEYAAQKLRTSLDRLMMVGDSRERDVDGARQAGVKVTVLVDGSASFRLHPRRRPRSGFLEIEGVRDLPTLLGVAP